MKAFCILTLLFASFTTTDGCTAVSLPASSCSDNVAITMHTTDCSECDFRLALVPGRTHEEGAMHAVYGMTPYFPRKSDGNRATIYQNVPHVEPIAWIPEVNYTYGVWESSYSLINEKGLSFGESSCSSKIPAAGLDMPDKEGKLGTAYFCIAALMQLGLERCADAVCAIKTMGALAEKYGFFGESYMGGEALTITDISGDAWVFHIMQDYSTSNSAIWAAQKVPDGHVAVLANEFTIQKIPIDGEQITSGFMWSENIKSEAIAAGFWDGNGEFDFQQVYGSKTVVGDNLYATMRNHWVYNFLAPSLKLELETSPSGFNFSYPVDGKVSIEDMLESLRGNYEGTEWDLTKGMLSGPFGNPKRIEGGAYKKIKGGAFPRPISIPRTSHVHVGISHPENSASLYGVDESGTTVYAPFFTKTLLKARDMDLDDTATLYSKQYQIGRRDKYVPYESAWWAFNIVANQLNFNYQNMTAEYVKPAIKKHQAEMLEIFRSGDDGKSTIEAIDNLVKAWWSIYDTLIVRYNDGYFNYAPGHNPRKPYETFGYPMEYLLDIGFDKDFWKTQTVQMQVEKGINKACGPQDNEEDQLVAATENVAINNLMLGIAFLVGGAATLILQKICSCCCCGGSKKDSKQEPLLEGVRDI